MHCGCSTVKEEFCPGGFWVAETKKPWNLIVLDSKMNDVVFKNGILSTHIVPPAVSTLLQAIPGAYTTTRTHNGGSGFLFWDRHLSRLANSVNILLRSKPELMFKSIKSIVSDDHFFGKSTMWDLTVRALVNDSMKKALPVVLEMRKCGEEMVVTVLVSGNLEKLGVIECMDEDIMSEILDIYLHFGSYIPLKFGVQGSEARLAVVGPGRNLANAKYSDWARQRKQLDKLRPPSVTELLLSSDGDHILEGCVTNVFLVCCKTNNEETFECRTKGLASKSPIEIQTAPLSDGVLPGVIRQVIIDICSKKGIPLREISPSWRRREIWEEAFITNGLRLMQHVQTIMAPNSWEVSESKTWRDMTWEEKQFKESPGCITSIIKEELMEVATHEAYPVVMFDGR